MTDFPSLKNELRPKAKLKRHADTPATDAEIEANSRLIGEKWGASTSMQMPELLPEPVSRVVSIRGYMPHYLDDELARTAAERRVTKTFLIMEALVKAGYHVMERDMIQDRRKKAKASSGN